MEGQNLLFHGITPEELISEITKTILNEVKELHSRQIVEEVEIRYLTREEVANLLKISLPTLHDWCKKGILKSYRMGKRVYFKKHEVDQALKEIYPVS